MAVAVAVAAAAAAVEVEVEVAVAVAVAVVVVVVVVINLCPVLTNLKPTVQLILGCHGAIPWPFNTY